MTLAPTAEPVPLTTDADGIFRVGATRVTLDTVVGAFRDGVSAEGIVERYPAVALAEVYSVIGYYLNHRAEVDSYLQARRTRAEFVRAENECRFDPAGVRARLLARRDRDSGLSV